MSVAPQWYFREFEPGDNLSDPDFAKALFASDGEAPLARSLIREGIQNSLDAKRADAEGVRVRISVLRGANAVPADRAYPFLLGGWSHLGAPNIGLEEPPSQGESIPCLVVEDFGTYGLRGNPEHWQPTDIAKNGFYLFFRALGRSGKADEERGRWGVGKFVFPMSSRGHSIWGLTIPSDRRQPMLMGRTVLRTHTIGATSFHPDGHWGRRNNPPSKLVSAVSEPEVLEQFRTTFGVTRRDEPGLSVVVPWLDPAITSSDLRSSILAEYFMPLLKGELTVEIVEGAAWEVLDADSVRRYAITATPALLRERLALAVAISEGGSREFVWPRLFTYDDTEWATDGAVPELVEELRQTLETGCPVSVVLPVTIREKGETAVQPGKLVVHLRQAEGLGSNRPLLIRDGISVSEDKTKSLHDCVAIMTTDAGALATLIGDAETPAHEKLQHDLIKNKYVYPKKMISFVREAPANLMRVIWQSDEGDDPFALANYFPLLADDGRPAVEPRPTPEGPAPEPKPKIIIPSNPKRFIVRKFENGFKVQGLAEAESFPEELSVVAAYDVRRGSPFKRYRKFDFDLAGSSISIASKGCQVASVAENRMVVRPDGIGFSLEVVGFDPKRDLIVRVTPQGGDE